MLAGITNANEQRPTSAGKSSETDVAAAKNASWTRVSNLHQARLTIIGTVVVVAAIVLCLGFFVNWGLAALSVIILVPGAISLAILAKYPESTSGRSMFGISNPDALLDPIRRPSERRGK